jgi:hemerythrin-like domain-containing protein
MESDGVAVLEHDHLALSQRVLLLRTLFDGLSIRRVDLQALARDVSALQDELLVHFAREEEVLFPFVVERCPDLSDDVARLNAEHDAVCGGLERLRFLAESETSLRLDANLLATFDRFERTYAEHAREELALLRTVAARLTGVERQQIAELVRGI